MNPYSPNPYWSQPQAGFYHPHIYYPPGYPATGYPPQAATGFATSKKYPSLNPCLAVDSCNIHPDLRRKPRHEIIQSTFQAHRHSAAMAYNVTHMRLISKSFPWTIDIVSQTPVTVEAVWDAMFAALQEHLHDSEWGCICQDKKQRETIEKAAEKRGKNGDADKQLKRIDWLGEATVFKGLEKSEEYEKLRLFPGAAAVAETWIIKLGTN